MSISLVKLLMCSADAETDNYPKTRDPWLWPFSRHSIWNMPIGSNAAYVPADLKPAEHIGCDLEWHIIVGKDDPVYPVFSPSSWKKRWPGNKKLGTLQFPNDLIIPDADPPHTPNACAAFLMPDGRTIRQLEPACRIAVDKHIVGWLQEDQDIYGDGIKGTHFGSGLSAIGGSIRKGELTGDHPIRHALKLNLWGEKYLFYSREIPGFRWPADRADAYAAKRYGGKNSKLVMGTLLGIPPVMTPEKCGIKSVPGKKLFYALQHYGAYISDDSAWDSYDLCVERGVPEEVKAEFKIDMTGRKGILIDEINLMISELNIVDNNSQDNIGGGGEPAQPLAPKLVPKKK